MTSQPTIPLPPSTKTVSVRIIDSTTRLTLPTSLFVSPVIPGHEQIHAPSYSFLIEHSSGRKLLFDNGARKDWQNYSPKIRKLIEESPGWEVSVQKDVIDILRENGIKPEEIEAIVWSHYHWDHIGNPSLFPPSTTLIVGPGFKASFLPGYPHNPNSPILASDYQGRHIVELSFTTSTPLGGLRAHDYFGDGSFYLLEAPGHAIGQMCGLARVTLGTSAATSPSASSISTSSSAVGDGDRRAARTETNPQKEKDTFILLASDTAHHPAELLPTPSSPLPPTPTPSPYTPHLPHSTFHTSHLRPLHRCPAHYTTTPFYELTVRKDGSGVAHDPIKAKETLQSIEAFDALGNCWVVLAHDGSLLLSEEEGRAGGGVEFFPKGADGWCEKGWKERVRWVFLRDFRGAVEGEGEIERG